jgi:hypothetical protein
MTKNNKMTIANLGCICIFLIEALLIVTAAQAGEITVKYKIVASITKIEFLPVPDMKGHVIGALERNGVVIYENGETAAYQSMIMFDSIKGQEASWSGYSILTFADGSKTFEKSQGTEPEVKGKKIIKGTGDFIKGTGRFEGIKGKTSFAGKYVTPYTRDKTKGDIVVDVISIYTLPKK